mgnify:CR=1 FL=1
MADLNTKEDRVYYVLQMNLKCDADEATKWIKTRSVKYTKDLQEEKPDKRLYSVTSKKIS